MASSAQPRPEPTTSRPCSRVKGSRSSRSARGSGACSVMAASVATPAAVHPPSRWTAQAVLGLFRGVRTYTLTPTGGGTRFDMREEYTGPLLGLIWRSMPDLQPSFDRFAAGLEAARRVRCLTPAARDPFETLGDPNRRAILGLLGTGRPFGAARSPRHCRSAARPRPATCGCSRRPASSSRSRAAPAGSTGCSDEGLAAVHAYLERVWGEAGARFRLMAENTEPLTEPLRFTLRRRLPRRPRVRRLDVGHRHVVAGRPHRHRRGRAGPSSSSPGRRPHLRADRRRRRARLGRGHPSGTRRRRLDYLWFLRADRVRRHRRLDRLRPGDRGPARASRSRTPAGSAWARAAAPGATGNHQGWSTLLPHFGRPSR